jgi:putative ABC transport system permease protein
MLSDLRYGIRQLLKKPGFTAVAVLTLALGIGVNTTMFSVLNVLVLQGSASPDSGRLVSLFRTSAQSQTWPLAPANFFDFQKQNTSFECVGACWWNNSNLAEPGQPAQRLSSMVASSDLFSAFKIPPELGRVPGPESDAAGSALVAVLSDGFWRSHFAADPKVIGRTVRLDGEPTTIIGVMPPEFENPLYWGHIDLWRPLAMDAANRQIRDNAWMMAVGRLKPGVTLGQAQSEANTIAARLEHDFPKANAGNGLHLTLWNDVLTNDLSRRLSWLCMGLAGFVLLIACANLANLQLARMTERVREYAVRIALGASRFQLMRQLLVESLLLSALGGAVGVVIAAWGTRVIGGEIFITGVQGLDLPINTTVLVFTLVASALTGVAVGVIPASIATRTDVNAALKQGGRGATGDRSAHRLRKALIVAELALALVLLSGAGFIVRGMQRVARADLGWRPDGLTTGTLSLPYNAKYYNDAQCRAFFDKLALSLAALPGVQQDSISAYLPIVGFWRSSGVAIQGRPPATHGKEPLVYYNSVTPGYFANLGIPVTQGRGFTDADRPGSRNVTIINESMAKQLWPGQNPIGQRIEDVTSATPEWLEIVGVARDAHATLELVRPPDTPFQVYLPLLQTPSSYAHWLNVAVRSSAPAATVADALRKAVQQIDPDQPIYAIASARESMEQITRGLTLTGQMLAAFALVGLILSAVGLYGVIANLVAQRTTEIGIRMALGAEKSDILWLVLGQGVRLSLLGTVIGVALAWGLVRALNSILPSIPGGDPLAIAGVAALLAAVALFASWLPARRATRVDPMVALRGD